MISWLTPKSLNQTEIEILNSGLKFTTTQYMEPIQAHLREHFPVLTSSEQNRYNKICQNALKFGVNEVYKLVSKKGTSLVVNDLKPIMLRKYPWVNEDNILGVIYKGIYLAEK